MTAMTDDKAAQKSEDAEEERLNGYLYRQHTKDFMFTAAEWEDQTKTEIDKNFMQNLIDEESMSTKEGGGLQAQGGLDAPVDVTSIHSHISVEKTEEERLAEEEAERLKEPFRVFNKDSYKRLVENEAARKLKAENAEEEEGRLVDGEIVFDEATTTKQDRDPKLADGMTLPEKMGRFPKELFGIPLEEIDPYIKEKSYVAIAKKFSKFTIFRFTATKSLFIFTPWNPIRKFCIQVISNQWFDLVILLSIVINCIMMIVSTDNEKVLLAFDILEYIFQGVYTLELMFKVISRGFVFNKYGYLRDGWNWLDFGVVIIAYVTIVLDQMDQGDVSLSGIRAFRVLRSLKSISVVPGLRTIVNALLNSLKMLAEVMLLTLFCIAVFALLALQLYMGALRNKCVLDVPTTYNFCNATVNGTGGDCFADDENFKLWYYEQDDFYQKDDDGYNVVCGTIAQSGSCKDGHSCVQAGPNPNWGFTHFDNFPWAMLNTFQLVSLDYWENTYNMIIDANGPWNILFFMMVVLLGSFYLMNLMLAVVAMAYEQEADVEAKLAAEEEEEEKAKAKRKENTAMLFDPKKLKMQLLQKQKDEEEAARKLAAGEDPSAPSDSTKPPAAVVTTNNNDHSNTNGMSNGGPGVIVATKSENFKNPRPVTATGQFVKTGAPGTPIKGEKHKDQMEVTDLGELERGFTPSPTKTQGSEVTASGVNTDLQGNNVVNGSNTKNNEHVINMGEEEEEDEDAFHDDLPDIKPKQQRYLIQKYATLWFNKIKPDNERLIDRNWLCCAKPGLNTYHGWVKFQNQVFKLASHGFFELFITLSIICNTAIMATELYDLCEQCRHCPGYLAPPDKNNIDYSLNYTLLGSDLPNCTICPQDKCEDVEITSFERGFGMKDNQVDIMEISNVVFTIIFTLEATIKLTAFSKEYFTVGWNNFDLFIVILSLPDLVIYFGKYGNIPGVSELAGIVKIFRLMRIIKLAQSWGTMRTLLAIIFQTMGALGNLTAILALIMFIFAVLGNQLLGTAYAKFQDPETHPELADFDAELPRWHFNTFFHSFLMVFRILCGEWIEPLWDCMRVISPAGCNAFFLGTLVIGNFMVLNLFLALLLNAFTADNLEESKSNEESKMVGSIKDLINCCRRGCKTARAVTPSSEDMMASQLSLDLHTQSRTRLNSILSSGDPKPEVAINGSRHSVKDLIEATNPNHNRNGSIIGLKPSDGKDGIELKPLANGLSKTSRSGSIISILSNGTNVSNGVLKNKGVTMSPENLRQIENAFNTNRDEYADFEASMDSASAPKLTPTIVMEDENAEKKTTLFSPDEPNDEDNPPEKTLEDDTEEKEGDNLIGEDGTVNLPDCCWAVCQTHPKVQNCCPHIWTTHREVWAKVVSHPVFDGIIMFLIAASSITLCFEGVHLHEDQLMLETLNYLNIVFAVLFFLEMIVKWLALGFKNYFTSFWTILDFVIVNVAIIDILASFLGFDGLSAFKILRVLRALRPLRAVSRWQNMKIVVNALIYALPAIGNVFVVIFVFWLIFAIMGVQIFRGLFYVCYFKDNKVIASKVEADFGWACDAEQLNYLPVPMEDFFSYHNFSSFGNLTYNGTNAWPTDLSECRENTELVNLTWAGLCERLGGEWSRPLVHFDNVAYAYLALFQVATFEGWMEVMEASIDAPLKMGGQGFRESRLYWYVYFMIFIIFGAFFTLNLFIGVIIDNFNVLKKKYDGSYLAAFLTENQRHYYNTLKKLGNKKPQKTIRRPKNKFQAFFFDIAVDTRFEITITLVIFLNMVVMMLSYLPEPKTNKGILVDGIYTLTEENQQALKVHGDITQVTEYINIIFTFVFVLEAVIKIIGLRFHYFRRAWNVFDFVVVALSLVDIYSFFDSRFGKNPSIILERMFEGDLFISPTLLRVVRVFRIGRVLRLVKSAKGIRKLLFALIISIPALFNIAILLFIFMFIFAVMGTTLFARVRHVLALTDTVNFDTFPNSMVALFRLSTSAGWNDVLEPLQDPASGCNKTHYIDTLGVPQESSQGECGNEFLACVFLIAYLFLSFMIIINMYIAVILENFTQAHEQEEIGITEDDFDMFYVVWEKYDPLATQYIKLEQLSEFLSNLEDPLGVPKPNGMAVVAFNLPIVEGDRIHCLDVLMALVRRVLHTNEEENIHMSKEHKEANEKLKAQIADKYRAAFPQRQRITVLSTTMQRKKEDVAAKTLQRAWRKHRMKQNILRIKELARDASQRDSLSRRLSDTLGSIKSRIGSAMSRLSRRGSTRSIRSIDSQTLNVPPELQNNRLSPNVTPRLSRHSQR